MKRAAINRVWLLVASMALCGLFTTWLCSSAPGQHVDIRKLDSRWQNHGKHLPKPSRLQLSTASLQWEKPVHVLIAQAFLHTVAMAVAAAALVLGAALALGYLWERIHHPVFRFTLDSTLGVLSSIPSLIVLLVLLSCCGTWILCAIDSPNWGMGLKLAMGAMLWALPTGCTFTHQWISSLQRFASLPCHQTALAQGASPHRLYWHHASWFALRETAQSLYQMFLAFLMGGVVIETFLDIPGLGMLTWQSWQYRDYPLVMGLALFFCVLYWGIDRGRDPWLPTA